MMIEETLYISWTREQHDDGNTSRYCEQKYMIFVKYIEERFVKKFHNYCPSSLDGIKLVRYNVKHI